MKQMCSVASASSRVQYLAPSGCSWAVTISCMSLWRQCDEHTCQYGRELCVPVIWK